MMIGQTVTFDGHRLNDLFRVGAVGVGLPSLSPTTVEARRGSLVRTVRMGTSQVSVPLVTKRVRGHPVREGVSTLMSWLDVDGARFLELSGDGGLRRLVVPTGAPSVDDAEYGDVLTLTFEQVDPYLYGATRTVSLASADSSVSLSVGGDAPTRPTIACSKAYGAATTFLWRLTLDDATNIGVNTGTTAKRAVTIDCDARTATVAGTVTTITLDSDWLELTPGTHTLSQGQDVGTRGGATTVTWTERWHA